MAPLAQREKTAEFFFETLKVPALYLGQQPALALYAVGRTTGLVIESGHGLTQVLPHFEGYRMAPAGNKVALGGIDVTHHLARLLTERGHLYTRAVTSSQFEIVREIKEKLASLSFSP